MSCTLCIWSVPVPSLCRYRQQFPYLHPYLYLYLFDGDMVNR